MAELSSNLVDPGLLEDKKQIRGMNLLPPKFEVIIDHEKCIRCQACVQQCSYDTLFYDERNDKIGSKNRNCVSCVRCVHICPVNAIKIRKSDQSYAENANWTPYYIQLLHKQAMSGGVVLTGMGNDKPYPIYWDKMLLNASQVTNPSIDPLREPMELKTFIGSKPEGLDIEKKSDGDYDIKTTLNNQIELSVPIMISAMSYGSVSYNVAASIARAVSEIGTLYNTGEGGLHKTLYKYGKNTIVQVASGRFGVHSGYLNAGVMVEIKIGQGAKPGIGGHLPGEKINEPISKTRMIPTGSDAISPAPHHDIYSIEDLRQLIYAIKEATNYKPVSVKIAAVHNVAAIASGIVHAGADMVAIDGFRGGTGAAPLQIRDNIGIPIELALAAVDTRLREEGIRHKASLVIAGGIRCSADIVKAIALGADAVYVGTPILIALGCQMCQQCHRGKCTWGICTQNPKLVKRLNIEVGTQRIINLFHAWAHEIKEMLGAMGINSIESLRGNRLHLRGVGLTSEELDILGILPAGK